MKYLLAVILSLSLYAPSVAKFLAYAECSALAVTQADQNWCDCMLTADTDTDGIPATEKQKDIAFKTDWKYTAGSCYQYAVITLPLNSTKNGFLPVSLCLPYKTDIFHPPIC